MDLVRFKGLGVITDKSVPYRKRVIDLITELDNVFEKSDFTKGDIVRIIARYLPNAISIFLW